MTPLRLTLEERTELALLDELSCHLYRRAEEAYANRDFGEWARLLDRVAARLSHTDERTTS